MKLTDIYDQLASGELRQIVMGTGPMPIDGVAVPTTKQKEILPLAILGITEIHKRFKLREGRAIVPLVTGQSLYDLSSATDIIQVEEVKGVYRDKPVDIPLNTNVEWGITTPTLTTLSLPTDVNQAPWLKDTPELTVSYRADHPQIDTILAGAAPQIIDILLPAAYLQALVYYIAARVTSSLGASEGYIEGDSLMSKFEFQCTLLTQNSFNVERDTTVDKLHMRGWV